MTNSDSRVTRPVIESVADVMEGAPKHVIDLVDLIKRTGAYGMQMREVSDPGPSCWVIYVEHYLDDDGYPSHDTENRNLTRQYDFTAAPTLGRALVRMVKQLYDGGTCMNCQQPLAFYAQLDGNPPFIDITCQVYWHPTECVYTRSCMA